MLAYDLIHKNKELISDFPIIIFRLKSLRFNIILKRAKAWAIYQARLRDLRFNIILKLIIKIIIVFVRLKSLRFNTISYAGYSIRETAKEGYETMPGSDPSYPTQRPDAAKREELYKLALTHL